ncbi:MAG: aconitate hydratase [Tissierellia bacterium]|nr:aconitate hydratase [Tissierellia bacterium]
MGKTLAYKILESHLLEGNLKPGEEIKVKVNQTLTQDSTGTMAYLQLEAMEPEEVQTDLSVAYIDHNMLQSGFENADDHAFIASAAEKYGIIFSKPGGGICHQVHLERFGIPGTILIGSDSHTPTGGGLGAIAIGAGGLDVAVGMARGIYYLTTPKVFQVELTGSLPPMVNAKDVILEVLRRLTVKGGVGYIMEYTGEGVKNLSVTDRATICNMGAELGATTSIFPSDEITRKYLKRQGREKDYLPLSPDADAIYDNSISIDLNTLTPLTAGPHSPDNVLEIKDEKIKVDQVAIGSCTNSSYGDMMKVAEILKGKQVHPDVSLVISPGSANILRQLSENGALSQMILSGARILESACGPCIGMGQAPKSEGVSLRTFNRNFKGRSGTKDAKVYLVSPETAAVSAITGYLTDPSTWSAPVIEEPDSYGKVDHYFVYPKEKDKRRKTTMMGPNIKPFPLNTALPNTIEKKIIFKAGDNITTDDIVPSNAKLLPYRSNIPHLASFAFTTLIDDFEQRAKENHGGFIVGGENYGQGSSREHAALVPLYLGIVGVIAKSFARIHRSNLINTGILPLVFKNKEDYEKLEEGDLLRLDNLKETIGQGDLRLKVVNKDIDILLELTLSPREEAVLREGGYLNYSKHLDGGKK